MAVFSEAHLTPESKEVYIRPLEPLPTPFSDQIIISRCDPGGE